jgi:hypothetical protein
MKIRRIKFYQSIKCNSIIKTTKNEYSFIDSELDPYTIIIKDNLIIVSHKETGETTCTAMHNVVYFNPYEK